MKDFIQPQKTLNYDNDIRKAGFELEFANIDMETIVQILTKECELSPKKVNNYLYKFDSIHGEYTLELDFELLTKQKLKKDITKLSKKIGITIEQKDIEDIESFIGDLSKDIVPYEICTPPIPLDQLNLIDALVESLKKHKALGTKGKLYYAFGLHINLEVISLKPDSLLQYLRAYVILQDYLTKDADIDVVRKITPFIDDFKKDYIEFILQEDYAPSQEELINDYIRFNPTRNRSLDMLPIFGYLDEPLVREHLPEEKIKPRPTFHYRLSNSMIGEYGWKISKEWNRWITVEKLANDQKSLATLSKNYLEHLDSFINLTTWESKVKSWLKNQ